MIRRRSTRIQRFLLLDMTLHNYIFRVFSRALEFPFNYFLALKVGRAKLKMNNEVVMLAILPTLLLLLLLPLLLLQYPLERCSTAPTRAEKTNSILTST